MKPIATYVFFDLETTNLPNKPDGDTVEITELGLLAVKRRHLLNLKPNEEPRVQYKIRMCFNPQKPLDERSAEISGLSDQLLKHEALFNTDTFSTISFFISCLEEPVCLVAHNGFRFHIPILKQYFERLHVKLSDDVMCTDSLYAFYDILENENIDNASDLKPSPKRAKLSMNYADKEETGGECKTYDKEIPTTKSFQQIQRYRFYFGELPKNKYTLHKIYERVVDDPHLKTNRAENQCIMMMKIAIARAEKFVEWVDENHCAFSEVPIE